MRNFTPHTVNIVDNNGNVIKTFNSEGNVRVKSVREFIRDIIKPGMDIPLYVNNFGEIEDLPENNDNCYIIVSRLVKSAMEKDSKYKDILDLYIVPEDIVRDKEGNIIGCKGFSL